MNVHVYARVNQYECNIELQGTNRKVEEDDLRMLAKMNIRSAKLCVC